QVDAQGVQLPEAAVAHQLAGEAGAGAGALVAAGLEDALVRLDRVTQRPPLADRVGQRLLAVDVEPGVGGGDPGQGVHVVRGGDDDGVQALVVEQVAEVAVGGAAPAARALVDQVARLGAVLGVDVADGHHLDVFFVQEHVDEAPPTATGADDADGDAAAGCG